MTPSEHSAALRLNIPPANIGQVARAHSNRKWMKKQNSLREPAFSVLRKCH